jgi:hypothetical protein
MGLESAIMTLLSVILWREVFGGRLPSLRFGVWQLLQLPALRLRQLRSHHRRQHKRYGA